uniref:Myeloid-associated differentiation marker n=1 Tax=Geotrypetes seraphini TaxID=260995 RepID=A0A6P8SH46_GEOSA|nr:myeloid-associated differentiation marker [Geotrypetes seraphini]XP_033817893.1 myeloid-associated differentiation marker [Geotrypetes seraphini]XP_033817894.1 myeloid-associated differentiation marker [Geotrypetes seraphini]
MPIQRTTMTTNTGSLISPVGIIRLLEVLFTCVAFSLVAHKNAWYTRTGDWCMFSWCFCFAVTLLILGVEFAGLQARMPVSWKNFPITFAMFAVLMCLSASIIYPLYFLDKNRGEMRDYQIAATTFSCLATVAYICEVSMTRAKPGEVTGYMATVPGLLKAVETFVACVIFVFISDPPIYDRHDALKYCLAVYCICFILSVVVIILCVGECTGWLPIAFDKFLSAYALLAVLLYASAMIIWPIFNFDRNNGGTPKRPRGCSSYSQSLCIWDKQLAIAILTAVNLIMYVIDLLYSAHLIFIQV